MRRVVATVLIGLIVAVGAYSIDYVYATQITLVWDAAPGTIWIDLQGTGEGDLADLDGGGTPSDPVMEAVISVEYEVGYSPLPVVDRDTPVVIVGSTPTPEYMTQIALTDYWQAWAVRAWYTTESGTSVSRWAWSDSEEDTGGAPFVLTSPEPLRTPPPVRVRIDPS